MADCCVINQDFIRKAAQSKSACRLDGRSPSEFRAYRLSILPENGLVQAQVGNTIVRSIVTGELVPPSRDRPNEGRLYFSVQEVERSSTNQSESGRSSGDLVQVCNHVERVLRGSKAIDTESLCVLGGKSVWSIRCDTFIEHDDGGLKDVCSLAALCALMNFRHEAVAYEGNRAVLFPAQTREPVPISIHHLPISTTFALFETPENGVCWLMDPSSDEEHAFQSMISVTVNQHGELCGIDKSGGLPICTETLSECVLAAVTRTQQISRDIRSSFGK